MAQAATSSEPASLIGQRLELMKSVAAHKWANGMKIEAPERERVVIDSARRSGLNHQLTVVSVEALFALQIEAAKEIQGYWFEQWRSGEPAPAAPDLAGELRPRLLELGDAILLALAEQATIRNASVTPIPQVAGLSAETRAALSAAVADVSRYPDRLTQILDAGVLRVGTTGDYQPFSWREDEHYRGIDISMAENLALALGVKIEWVPTSWPMLMSDLNAGRFDIAMSGVSRITQRARSAYFSQPYYIGGKTAIARCDQADRFNSLEEIDQPGVRVVVNPGGTNERFVDTNINRAEKLLHPDNRTVFAELIAGRADVMFTDAIEVAVHTAQAPELCRAVSGLLSYQEKGYLLPVDEPLKAFVDLWLDNRLGDGFVAGLFAEQGVELTLD